VHGSGGATLLAHARAISDEGFGFMTAIRLPSGGELALYQPKHPSPLESAPGDELGT
jgi:hypothetical protein